MKSLPAMHAESDGMEKSTPWLVVGIAYAGWPKAL